MKDIIKSLSVGTKALTIFIVLCSGATLVGIMFVNAQIKSVGFGLLVGTAIMNALDDPETEDPVPLWFRIIIGYFIGIIFGGAMYITPMMIWNP